MPGVLPAEDGVGLGHLRLDERVAYAGPDRDPAVLGDDLGDGTARDQVVDDGRARLVSQLAGRDERGEHRRADDLALLVHDEAAVGVAVEGQADVGLVLDDRLLQVAQVRRVDRVGLVVGERAVQLEVQRDQVKGRPSKTVGTESPAIPLPASATTFSGRIPDRSTSFLR